MIKRFIYNQKDPTQLRRVNGGYMFHITIMHPYYNYNNSRTAYYAKQMNTSIQTLAAVCHGNLISSKVSPNCNLPGITEEKYEKIARRSRKQTLCGKFAIHRA